MAVLTPIRRPLLSSSGPPELPGLIDASVCTQPVIGRPLTPMTSLPRAETTPVVSVKSSPNGLPMAMTDCPTSRSDELPTAIGTSSSLQNSSF